MSWHLECNKISKQPVYGSSPSSKMAAIIEKVNFTKNNYTNEYVIVVFNSSSCDPVHTNSHLYMQTVDIDEKYSNVSM